MHPHRRLVRTSTALTLVGLAAALVIHQAPMLSAARHRPIERAAGPSSEAEAQAPRPGDGVTAPAVVYQEKPTYTPEALAAKVQGTVLLDVVVLGDGTVGEVVVTKSLDAVHGLDDAAVSTVKRWRFAPGTRDGIPLAVTVTIEVMFSVKD